MYNSGDAAEQVVRISLEGKLFGECGDLRLDLRRFCGIGRPAKSQGFGRCIFTTATCWGSSRKTNRNKIVRLYRHIKTPPFAEWQALLTMRIFGL